VGARDGPDVLRAFPKERGRCIPALVDLIDCFLAQLGRRPVPGTGGLSYLRPLAGPWLGIGRLGRTLLFVIFASLFMPEG
jgi:hypothetical protein